MEYEIKKKKNGNVTQYFWNGRGIGVVEEDESEIIRIFNNTYNVLEFLKGSGLEPNDTNFYKATMLDNPIGRKFDKFKKLPDPGFVIVTE